MRVGEEQFHTIWLNRKDPRIVEIIDQRWLPHKFHIEQLKTLAQAAAAISEMHVRGAPLIGATAAFGMYLAALELEGSESSFSSMEEAGQILKASRPTAVNLAWAVDRVIDALAAAPREISSTAKQAALEIIEIELEACRQIGLHGAALIEDIARQKNGEPVNVLTHCNAGWLACIDYGTATAPIYEAQERGCNIHIWVDETRPRNQGARLTAWELGEQGVEHTVICDNTGGHLMQHGKVDIVIVGTDRTSRTGDVANKIGTYLKALAAFDNDIPFYVAAPSSSIDWSITDGVRQIPIEERNSSEVREIQGLNHRGEIARVLLTPSDSKAANYAFDVTPARLISGLITERGLCPACEPGILELFPEKK